MSPNHSAEQGFTPRIRQTMPSSAATPSFVTVVIGFLRGPSVAESREPQDFLWAGLAGPVHDDRDPDQAERTAQQIEAVGRDAVDGPAPDNREHDEHAAVRRVDAAEMLRLVRRYESIEDEDGGAQHPDERRRARAPPLPDEVAAPDLAEPGEDEQRQRPDHAVPRSGPLKASSLGGPLPASSVVAISLAAVTARSYHRRDAEDRRVPPHPAAPLLRADADRRPRRHGASEANVRHPGARGRGSALSDHGPLRGLRAGAHAGESAHRGHRRPRRQPRSRAAP